MNEFEQMAADRERMIAEAWEAMPMISIRRGGLRYPAKKEREAMEDHNLLMSEPSRRPTRKELRARIKELEKQLRTPVQVTLKFGDERLGPPSVQVFRMEPGTWHQLAVTAIATPVEGTPAIPVNHIGPGVHFLMSTNLQMEVTR